MGGSKEEKTTSEVKPPQWISNAQQDALRLGQKAVQGINTQPYTGGFNALPGPQEYAALNAARGVQQQSIGLGTPVQQYGQQMLSGQFLDPTQNQAFKDYINMSVYDPLYSRLNQQVLPGVQSSAIAQGAYGGSANAAGLSHAYRDTAAEAANQAARAGMQLYDTERRYQNLAPSVIQQGTEMNQQAAQQGMNLGAYGRQLQQIPLNESKAQFDEANAAPLRQVLPYIDMIRALQGGAGQTNITTGPGQGGSQAGGALAGGLGGAASGAALGSVFPVVGTGVGALLGGLLGAGGGWFG